MSFFLFFFKRNYSVFQTHVNMMVNAWRRFAVTSVSAQMDTKANTAQARIKTLNVHHKIKLFVVKIIHTSDDDNC